MRILLVSQMYPGSDDPDLGVFVAQLERALAARGHEIERAVLDRRAGGKLRYLELARRARSGGATGRRLRALPRPDGPDRRARSACAARAHRARPRRAQRRSGSRRVAAATRFAVRRAAAVIAVSDYLRRELEAKVPEARGKTEVVSSGVDLERFALLPRGRRARAGVPLRRLADASGRTSSGSRAHSRRSATGTLTFVGDGPLRAEVERVERVTVTGRVAHDEVPAHLARGRPCSAEPDRAVRPVAARGARVGRSVVATRIGGPPEFVTPEAGVLVDPLDEEAIADGPAAGGDATDAQSGRAGGGRAARPQ